MLYVARPPSDGSKPQTAIANSPFGTLLWLGGGKRYKLVKTFILFCFIPLRSRVDDLGGGGERAVETANRSSRLVSGVKLGFKISEVREQIPKWLPPSFSFADGRTWIKGLGKKLSLPSGFSHSCLALFRKTAYFTRVQGACTSMVVIRKNSRQERILVLANVLP